MLGETPQTPAPTQIQQLLFLNIHFSIGCLPLINSQNSEIIILNYMVQFHLIGREENLLLFLYFPKSYACFYVFKTFDTLIS